MMIYFFAEDFSKVTLFPNENGILDVDRDKIKPDDNNSFYENDPDTQGT